MRIWIRLSLIVLLASGVGNAQQDASLIPNPEALAGRWEVSDGHGGAVGMNIILTTYIYGTPATLAGQPQFEGEFTVGLYQRAGSNAEPFGFNFFNAPNGGASWDGHRIRIHLTGKADLPTTDVELVWHPESQTWSGLFERGQFHKQVVLKRPTSKSTKSPFVGTWFQKRSGMMNNCVHIAQQQDETLAAWSDDIMIPRRVRYANGIQPRHRLGSIMERLQKQNWTHPIRLRSSCELTQRCVALTHSPQRLRRMG